MSFRPRRNIPSSVNAPTVTHIESSSHVSQAESERLLSEFIASTEEISGGSLQDTTGENSVSHNGSISAVLSQLKRVQRDLRGLPPVLVEVVSKPEKQVNKKIKFDEDDGKVTQAEAMEVDNSSAVEEEEEEEEDREENASDAAAVEKKKSKGNKAKKDKKSKEKKEKKSRAASDSDSD